MLKYFFILWLLITGNAKAQQSQGVYEGRIDTLTKNIYTYFYDSSRALFYETNDIAPNEKPHSYLWPLCALMQAANEAEALRPHKDYMTQVLKATDQYYTAVLPAPAYQSYVTGEEKADRFYDDNQWIAIALLDAYSRTKKHRSINCIKTRGRL